MPHAQATKPGEPLQRRGMTRVAAPWLAAILCAWAGCSTAGYGFHTDRQVYHPGDWVRLVLANQSGRDLFDNLCGVRLERRSGDHWEYVPYSLAIRRGPGAAVEREPQSRFACPLILYKVAPWGRERTTIGLNDDAPSGEYRLRTSIEFGRRELLWIFPFGSSGRDAAITTPTFTVALR